MTEWPDALAAGDFLALAKDSASETHRVLATRGYIRVLRHSLPPADAETARLLVAGFNVARRPEEKWQALGALGEVHNILALQTVRPAWATRPFAKRPLLPPSASAATSGTVIPRP